MCGCQRVTSSPPPMHNGQQCVIVWRVGGSWTMFEDKTGGDLLGIYMLGPDIDIDIGPTGRDHDLRDRGGAPWSG